MLTDIKCRNASLPTGKRQVRLLDSDGLILQVGVRSKSWIVKYRFERRDEAITVGKYPALSLKKARLERDRIKLMIDKGESPKQKNIEGALIFRIAAEEWIAKKKGVLTPQTIHRDWNIIETHLFPTLGDKKIESIRPRQMLDTLEIMEAKGLGETTRKARRLASSVFQYASIAHDTSNNPAFPLSGALKSITSCHRSALTSPRDIKRLMKSIDFYEGTPLTRHALFISAYVFPRPGELRRMQWDEIDFKEKRWVIPAEKMKMRRPHIVPLSKQVLDHLAKIEAMCFRSQFVFPGARSPLRFMSENTVNAAIRYLGFEKHEMCAHGFRGMASTRLHEMGYNSDIIELQLAHAPKNAVKAAYNHAEHLTERTKMIQEWADYLDALRNEDA